MGVIFYYLVSGVFPFNLEREEDIQKLFDGNPVMNPEDDPRNLNVQAVRRFKCVSEDCKNLIRRMLCADPVRRISIDDILQHPRLFNDQPRQDLEQRVNGQHRQDSEQISRIDHLLTENIVDA